MFFIFLEHLKLLDVLLHFSILRIFEHFGNIIYINLLKLLKHFEALQVLIVSSFRMFETFNAFLNF